MVPSRITRREADVLDGLARGLTNSEIAAELFMSTSSVKSHLGSVFRKFGVSNRTEAATYFLGLDPPR